MKKFYITVAVFLASFCVSAQIPGLTLSKSYLSFPSDSAIYLVNTSLNIVKLDSIRIKNPRSSAYGFNFRKYPNIAFFEVELHPSFNSSYVLDLQLNSGDTLCISMEGIDFCIMCKINDWVFEDTFQIFSNGFITEFDLKTNSVGVEDEKSIPDVFSISNNFPNPFNPSTILTIESNRIKSVELNVYDILGKLIYSSNNIHLSQGKNEFPISLEGFPSGQYLVILKGQNEIASKIITLIK
ncbi:MAG: T9SS type A sorting domain-containing protein [Bacteroidetes bacterium]|nr:T9SS type A sorting domain-containing protein [Bacteroidota bacterium]